jgi:hypothetical protein
LIVLAAFVLNTVLGPNAFAQPQVLPQAGAMVALSDFFTPVILKGIVLHPEDPLVFDFIVDNGNTGLKGQELTDEATTLAKYFLAGIAIPEKDLWVNLSPYEKDRIIEENFSHTDMGRDLLAQDYILKQLTSSLIYPEKELGKKFWDQVYALAQEKFGSTEIPVDTFNKVWIAPDSATVYRNGNNVMVAEAKLKVMLESDYLAQSRHPEAQPVEGSPALTENQENNAGGSSLRPSVFAQNDVLTSSISSSTQDLSKQVMREVIIPVLEKEVNEGRNFAQLRQVFYSMILANWYKNALKQSLLAQVYADSKKTEGIAIDAPKDQVEKIYSDYVAAFKTGVFNYIKEDFDRTSGEAMPRKYFSGGTDLAMKVGQAPAKAVAPNTGASTSIKFRFNRSDAAMLSTMVPFNEFRQFHVFRDLEDNQATFFIAPGASRLEKDKVFIKLMRDRKTGQVSYLVGDENKGVLPNSLPVKTPSGEVILDFISEGQGSLTMKVNNQSSAAQEVGAVETIVPFAEPSADAGPEKTRPQDITLLAFVSVVTPGGQHVWETTIPATELAKPLRLLVNYIDPKGFNHGLAMDLGSSDVQLNPEENPGFHLLRETGRSLLSPTEDAKNALLSFRYADGKLEIQSLTDQNMNLATLEATGPRPSADRPFGNQRQPVMTIVDVRGMVTPGGVIVQDATIPAVGLTRPQLLKVSYTDREGEKRNVTLELDNEDVWLDRVDYPGFHLLSEPGQYLLSPTEKVGDAVLSLRYVNGALQINILDPFLDVGLATMDAAMGGQDMESARARIGAILEQAEVIEKQPQGAYVSLKTKPEDLRAADQRFLRRITELFVADDIGNQYSPQMENLGGNLVLNFGNGLIKPERVRVMLDKLRQRVTEATDISDEFLASPEGLRLLSTSFSLEHPGLVFALARVVRPAETSLEPLWQKDSQKATRDAEYFPLSSESQKELLKLPGVSEDMQRRMREALDAPLREFLKGMGLEYLLPQVMDRFTASVTQPEWSRDSHEIRYSVGVSLADAAMETAKAAPTGGIDLGNGDFMKVIETDPAGMPVFDPASVQKFKQDLRGLVPVPIGVPRPVEIQSLLAL